MPTLTVLALLLALATPVLAGSVRYTTDEEQTLGRLQTLYADGTRAVSTWNLTLERWDTIIRPPAGSGGTHGGGMAQDVVGWPPRHAGLDRDRLEVRTTAPLGRGISRPLAG